MQRLNCSLIAVAVLMMAAGGSQEKKMSIESLSWISGCWEGRQKDSTTEEHWSKPVAQSMLGLSRTVRGGKTVAYEFMQIREEKDGLVFIAQPQGGTQVPFKAIRSAGQEITFENAEHDFPQRIIYKTGSGETLLPRIEGVMNGKQMGEDFPMKRVRCE